MQREGVNYPKNVHAHTNPSANGIMQLLRDVYSNKGTGNKPEKEDTQSQETTCGYRTNFPMKRNEAPKQKQL